MKQTIDGVTYDTDAAEEIAKGSHGHELSDAWWGLYRTDQGAFFEVVVDHDGTLSGFHPLTREEARRFLERHRNDAIEKYFGPTAAPEPIRFSRRTVIAAIEVIENARQTTHAALSRYLLILGQDIAAQCNGSSVTERLNCLIRFVDQQPHYRLEEGKRLTDKLVERAAELLPKPETPRPWDDQPSIPLPSTTAFLTALDRDGFRVTDGAICRALPANLKLPEAEDEIVRLLNKHGFSVAKGHLAQAFAAHAEGHWASANAQIRSFLDDLTDRIAEKLDPAAASLGSGQGRRAKLAALGFLSRDLNEWDDNGNAFFNGLVKRLHPHGSHPGLSDQDDSTFRLHIVLLTARLLLVRYDTRP
jgi:hypothetical protein